MGLNFISFLTMTKQTHILAHSAVFENQKVISPAFITIENGKITKISESIPKNLPAGTLEYSNATLFPGLTNAHCHLELTSLGPLKQDPFFDWVKVLLHKKKLMTRKDFQLGIQKGINLLKTSGVTTIIDHISPDTPLSSYSGTDISIILIGEILGIPEQQAKEAWENFKQQQTKLNLYPSPHALYSVNHKILLQVLKTTSPLSFHFSESPHEMDYFMEKGPIYDRVKSVDPNGFHNAASPIAYLKENQIPLKNSLLIHANHIHENDIPFLKSIKNIAIVHCPGSFHFFRHKNFPLDLYLTNNIPVALGTDSIASNSDLNLLLEIQTFLKDFPKIELLDLMPMITTNALKVFGVQNRGCIQEGHEAFIMGFENPKQIPPLSLLKTKTKCDIVLTPSDFSTQFS